MTPMQEKKNEEKAVKAIIKLTEGKARIDEVFPQVIDAHKCPSLYLEWTVENFWGLQTPKLIVELDKLYEKCVEVGHTEENKFNCNDGDDNLWYIDHKQYKVLVHTSQNRNHLYVWDKPRYEGSKPDLHIRRFYEIYDKERHGWSDDKDLMTVQEAINKAEHYQDDFADITYEYQKRYTLQQYKDADFEMMYKDGRDNGYVCSYNDWKKNVEDAMSHHHELKVIHECYIPSLCAELFEDERQVSDTIGNDEKGYDSWPKVEYNL